MNKRNVIKIIFTLVLCISCSCSEQVSKEYMSFSLEEESTPTLALKHNNWKVVEDNELTIPIDDNLNKVVYKISHFHQVDTISFPPKCEIYFCGGGIKGVVKFNENYLSGDVRLQGSTFLGSISNKTFEAGWNCYGNGRHDDAFGINQALQICNDIHFQDGTYLLQTLHEPFQVLTLNLKEAAEAHIGIYKSDVSLRGDRNTSFLTKDKKVSICVYSEPDDISNSIRNIIIDGITFRNENDKSSFNEYAHSIKVIGVNKLSITNCNFFDFVGDAICLSHFGNSEKNGERTRNSNIKITNNYIEGHSHNNRNGISVISGNNVLIANNTIEETTASNMPGAIDVEANNTAFVVNHVIIRNNVISGSHGFGGAISIICNERGAPAHNIKIENNLISNSTVGLRFDVKRDSATSNFKVVNNTIQNCKRVYLFRGEGSSKNWEFSGNKVPKNKNTGIGGSIRINKLKVK